MNLAAILSIYLLTMGGTGLGWSAPGVRGPAAQQPAGRESSAPQRTPSDPAPQPQPPSQSQSQGTAQPASPATTPATHSDGQPKPTLQRTRRHKKKNVPCSNAPDAQNPAPAGSRGTADPTGSEPASKPCPPPKKVVRNGGSEEPLIQLVGGSTADHTSQQRSTEQLAAATEENLRKIAGRQLTASQQDMVAQVKQFLDQSKTAVAAKDLERGHNLAQKAHLLSEELVKP